MKLRIVLGLVVAASTALLLTGCPSNGSSGDEPAPYGLGATTAIVR
ncbi:hypothetical protein ACGGZK_10665 [Agromyces sp. MMS24-K17]